MIVQRSARHRLAIAIAVLATAAAPARAQETADTTRVVDRLDTRDADRTLVAREGDAVLMIEGGDLYLQLTDRGLEDLEVLDEDERGESGAARILGAMLRAGARELLDHAIVYPIADLGRAEYVDDRLVLEDHEGDAIMQITLNGRDLMTDFRASEARAFARELRARMAGND